MISSAAELSEEEQLKSFKPVPVRSAADDVLAVLVDAIRGGLYGIGDRFPKERELAARLGVSRVVLRQAFLKLRDAGIVETQRGHGGGSMVVSLGNLAEVLSHLQGNVRFELVSLLEVRRATEPVAAVLTGRRASSAEKSYLRQLADDLHGHLDDRALFEETDMRFHIALGELSQNPMLNEIIRDLYNRLAVVREPFPDGLVDLQRAVDNQHNLLEAVCGGDPQCILAEVELHLADFERVMLGYTLDVEGCGQ